MHRRDFLKRTSAAGLAGVLLTQADCAPTIAGLSDDPSPDEMEAYLARLDRGREAIARMPVAGGLMPGDKPPSATNDRLTRDALTSLYMVGSFHDLTDAERMHPGMQARMRAELPTMDHAVLGTTAMLETASEKRLQRVRETLTARPELVTDLSEKIDRFGAQAGISIGRRLNLRTTLAEVAGRLKTQNPALLVDEYVKKVRRVEAQSGLRAESERQAIAKMGREAFWRQQAELEAKHLAWRERLNMGPPDGRAGNPTLTTGAIILGIGAGVETVGLLFLAAGSEGGWLLFGVTIGPITLLIGLIVTLVGLAIGDDDT